MDKDSKNGPKGQLFKDNLVFARVLKRGLLLKVSLFRFLSSLGLD